MNYIIEMKTAREKLRRTKSCCSKDTAVSRFVAQFVFFFRKNLQFLRFINSYKWILYLGCFLMLVTSIYIMLYHHIKGLNIEMLYIGQGDSLIIRNDNLTITIDGGSTTSESNGKYVLEPNLLAKTIDKIDIAFITHSDKDHTNCIEYLLTEGDIKIGTLVLPIFAKENKTYDYLKTLCDNNNIPIQYMKQYDMININDDLSFLCISPSENYFEAEHDINEQSLVLKMFYKNKSVLFTGDIGKVIEEKLSIDKNVSKFLNSDILKIAHHGSKNSNTDIFLDEVKPKYGIVSYGIGNKYGHPNTKTLDKFDNKGIKTYLTGESGEIDINIYGDDIKFRTYK